MRKHRGADLARRVEDALRRICEFQHAIGTTQAKSIPDAAVQLHRLAVLLDGQDGPILGLQAVLDDQRETVRRLLASALAAVELESPAFNSSQRMAARLTRA